ncbi:hypothetical protein CA54_30040 [Symmachiella macrocystis]|uniref:Microbial-type PARG catalytic domain-containing protein n=1 Tax=Symmachiella macrocystis TaxID=2527985 RepID=A0A5C6BRW8_9PLAN|nr:hypothetical protein [Symmachiella macrocystis]TWU14161.1 hypothetical protein CA54_30040 [Symmachiella macrocystis]
MTWFESLTGFPEESAEHVRANITIDGATMTSAANGRQMTFGRLETPNLAELRSRVQSAPRSKAALKVSEVLGDVQELHQDPAHAGALFQVASQFNLLEMVGPSATPEYGVGIYENDRTQGPACAIACGAGTIYRNYFTDVSGRPGQTLDNQIDCLHDLGLAIGNTENQLWTMRNGYALASENGLQEISTRLAACSEAERDTLRERLQIGIHWETEVTLGNSAQTVSQAYCSALPVAYSVLSADQWASFAQLVLEAAYEATFCAAILNAELTGNKRLFLTLLGGGAFGNRDDWIFAAMERAFDKYADYDLDVAIVSYRSPRPGVEELINRRG